MDINKKMSKIKVGILSFQRTSNYGAQLQNYALQEYLKKFNELQVSVINYKNKKLEKDAKPKKLSEQHGIKQIVKYVLTIGKKKKKWENFEKFRKEYMNLTEEYKEQDITRTEKLYDYFLVGSDQVWNTDITGNDFNYMLEFLVEDSKKYSYAASIGKDVVSKENQEEIIPKIKKFQQINVREETAKELLERNGIENANVVIDPVFLLKKEEWINKLNLSPKKGNYILAYMISNSNENLKKIKMFAEKEHLKVIYINNNELKTYGAKSKQSVSPKEFLEYIYGARYVITGSFHAVSFSLIFNKDFCFILDKVSKKGSRIIDLTNKLNVKNRDATDKKEIEIQNINYEQVNQRIYEEVTKSEKILENMIKKWEREI